MLRTLLFVLTFLAPAYGMTQTSIGSWRSHLPMNRFEWVGQLDHTVLAANNYGVIVYDEEDGSVETLTKTDRLSETGVTAFSCSYDDGLCVVGYGNGNLDLISSEKTVINLPAIVASNIVGDKQVNDILFLDGKALIATGIGMVLLDLTTFNVLEYAQIVWQGENAKIEHALMLRDTLYMVTPDEVLACPYGSLFTTQQLIELPGIPSPDRVRQLTEIADAVVAIQAQEAHLGDTLYRLEDGQFSEMAAMAGEEIRDIVQEGDMLLASQRYEIVKYDLRFNRQATIFAYSGQPGMDSREVRYDPENGRVLVADEAYGAIITTFEDQFSSTIIQVSSPRDGLISKLDQVDEVVYAMPGGNDFTFNPPFLFSFQDEEWTSRGLYALQQPTQRNTSGIARSSERFYVSFDGSGLIVYDDQWNEVRVYDEANAEIEDDIDGYYGVKGVEVDQQGNVWMLNSRATSTLSVLSPEDEWTLINLPGFPKPITDNFTRLSSGIFVFSLKEDGLIFYDPGDTPLETSDDRFTQVSASPTQGNLPNNTVNCLMEDQDGELWIGTDEGIGVLYSPESVFSENPEDVQRIIVSQDGFNGYLFEADAVIAMAVDGANRKWVAPRGGGLFLISPDGQEQLLRFTEEESPLLNNSVLDLLVEPSTGEVFIATESGLQSYRSDATQPAESLGSIKVFPNPVKPGYGGQITFSGLTSDSYLRVTDAAGNLVFETTSKGGTAVWDGNDRTGRRVSSGVYLVMAASRQGTGGAISKLLILNESP